MPQRKKPKLSGNEMKKVNSENDSSTDSKSESDSECSNENVGSENLDVDFVACTPMPDDYDMLLKLLRDLFSNPNVDVGNIADFIVRRDDASQDLRFGTVLMMTQKEDDEEELDEYTCSITTIVSLSEKELCNGVESLRTFIKGMAGKHGTDPAKKYASSVFENDKNMLGFVLNCRWDYIPATVAGPIFSDLITAVEKESGKNNAFKFTHYIFFCKLCYAKQPKNKISKEPIWIHPEDEIFDKAAEARVEYSVAEEGEKSEFVPKRRILFLSAFKFRQAVEKIKNRFQSPALQLF